MLARTATQVADLPNQHPRHDRHTDCFSSTMLRCSVAVFLSRLITVLHEEQVEMLDRVFVFAPYKRPPRSIANIRYEPRRPAGRCYRRQRARPSVSLRYTLRDAARSQNIARRHNKFADRQSRLFSHISTLRLTRLSVLRRLDGGSLVVKYSQLKNGRIYVVGAAV